MEYIGDLVADLLWSLVVVGPDGLSIWVGGEKKEGGSLKSRVPRDVFIDVVGSEGSPS